MLEVTKEPDDPKGRWKGGTIIAIDGRVITCITAETPRDAVERFIALAREQELELSKAMAAVDERVSWNMANPTKARDWPAFRLRDRLVNSICKQAGVINS